MRRQGDEVYIAANALEGEKIVAAITPLLGPGMLVQPSDVQAGSGPDAMAGMLRLSPERRAKLIAFVESNTAMTPEAKERALAQLEADEVPMGMVMRLESRMGS